MNYTKPTVAVLGEAAEVVQNQQKTGVGTDFLRKIVQPAYDLDE